ncbi:MAG: Coenzyme F420 hydrogenase/dehydrogenase, beta subunit C-terminal domain [Clostridia bacterium]|nr:Coenzyme F420 hydrogenase/dehydrogenase, beta subunit C-terminal domain [Clostridia bacterium]
MPFVSFKDKKECCGCSACADACPVSCIEMVEDSEFFLYPKVDESRCINCEKCLSVCPVKHFDKTENAINDDDAYAFVSNDTDLIKSSSSGGAFSVIMDAFAGKSDNFTIAGAAFSGTDVVHMCVNNREEAEIFKKSKYVQSFGKTIYKKVKNELENGKQVLFSGTPCMVAALKNYLGKTYDGLTTVDIVCHGVPNQHIFSEYLNELEKINRSKIYSVSFRVKRNFDTEFPNPRTMDVCFENGNKLNMDIEQCEYLYGFHHSLYFRPSCSHCKFSYPKRQGDITLGDYWGIEKINKELQSKKGVSLVRFNTDKGREYLEFLKKSGNVYYTSYSFACDENYQLRKPSQDHRNREKFFKLLRKGYSVIDAVNICKKPDTLPRRIIRKVKKLFM